MASSSSVSQNVPSGSNVAESALEEDAAELSFPKEFEDADTK